MRDPGPGTIRHQAPADPRFASGGSCAGGRLVEVGAWSLGEDRLLVRAVSSVPCAEERWIRVVLTAP
ncbi:MAG: hypothetical protein R3B82_05935 [Sandaracinaceae bacterium]